MKPLPKKRPQHDLIKRTVKNNVENKTEIWKLCLFNLPDCGTLQSSNRFPQISCFRLLLFFVSSVERRLQWVSKSSCASWFIIKEETFLQYFKICSSFPFRFFFLCAHWKCAFICCDYIYTVSEVQCRFDCTACIKISLSVSLTVNVVFNVLVGCFVSTVCIYVFVCVCSLFIQKLPTMPLLGIQCRQQPTQQ